MAIYTNLFANSPANSLSSWSSVMGQGSTTPPGLTPVAFLIINTDGTYTKIHGAFDLVQNILVGGMITAMERTSANGQTVYEAISGLNQNVNLFLNTAPQDRLPALFDIGDDQTYGYSGDDILFAGKGADLLVGGAGNDVLKGGAGPDKMFGGDGVDTADYSSSPSGVTVNLQTDTASGGDAQGDTLKSIENLTGSGYIDKLTGNADANVIEGKGGSDVIDGGAGDDTAVFSHNFNDYHVFEYGNEIRVVGPDGYDHVTSIEHLKFADVTITPAAIANDGNPLFDTLDYLSNYSDVFHSGANALDHFNTFGSHEGRNPNPFFNTAQYLAVYKDAAASGMNPLDHYHQIGWKLGYDPSGSFDTRQYLIHNPDVAAAGTDPLQHFLEFGAAQGRQTYSAIGDHIPGGFDAELYLRYNPDVAASGVDPLQHFEQFGWHEGRNPNRYFDTAGYLSHYGDVAAAGVNPLEHYMQFGWKEGRDPAAYFDTAGYLAHNPDVAAAGFNPLDHFLQFGIYEGRQAVSDGLWH